MFDQINSKLSSMSDWVIGHQDEVMTFIGDIGVGLIEAGKSGIDFAEGILRAVKGIIEAINDLPGWLGGPDTPIDTSFIDKTITSLDGIKGKLDGAKDWWRNYTDRAADALKFTEELGDTIRANLDDKTHEILLSAKPTDEQAAKLLDKGIEVKEIDGKFVVSATSPEGQKLLDAFRQQKGETPPVDVPLVPNVDPAALAALYKQFPWLDPNHSTPAPISTNPFALPPPGPPPPAPQHKRSGGAVYRFAGGGQVPGPGARSTSSADVAVFNRINAALAQATKQSAQLLDNIKATVNASGQIVITSNAPEVQDQLAALGLSIEKLPDGTIALKADTKEAEATLKSFKDKAEAGTLTLKTELAQPAPLPLPASGLPAGGPSGGGGSANPKGLDDQAAAIMAELHAAYPQMDLWGWGPNPDHNTGKCVDAMTLDNPNGLALGDRIVSTLLRDPRVEYMIWKQQYWYHDGRVLPYGDHGDRNKNHFTHPHIRTFQYGGVPGTGSGDIVPALLEPGEHVLTRGDVGAMGGQAAVYQFRNALHGYSTGGRIDPLRFEGGGQVPDWDAIAQKESGGRWDLSYGDADSTGGLQIQTRTWLDFGGGAIAPTAGQATKAQQIAIAEKVLAAQGPGAWAGGKNFGWKAGTGTGSGAGAPGAAPSYVTGVGPHGEQGYYKPADADKIRTLEAKIAELEGKQREDKAKIGELKADATESEKISAQNELDSTTRELTNTKADLAEAKTGEFTAGAPPSTHYEPYAAGDIREAENKAADADAKLRVAEAKLRELKADASESDRIAAQNEVDQAKREKANADADVAEKHRGKVTEGDASGTHKTDLDPKLNELAQMPAGIINGLLGDLGIGDIFPDLTQTPMWKSFAAGLTAFKGPIQGLVEGKLGVQQPGWQPGMPIPEPAGSGDATNAAGGGGSIPLPFGLPNIEIPPPPPTPDGEQHVPGGPGSAGPGNVSIDASINYPPGTVIGVDPVAQGQADERRQSSALTASVAPFDPGHH
jgi:hypothetical protein